MVLFFTGIFLQCQVHLKHVDYLVVCMDADYEGSIEKTKEKIETAILDGVTRGADFDIPEIMLVQNKCIESWFLGNREVYPQIVSANFRKFTNHYNVSTDDPEKMDTPLYFTGSCGEYHKLYLNKMLRENGLSYSESNTRHVSTEEYVLQLKMRAEETNHLATLKEFFNFIAMLQAI